jgi:hypothetical protein
MAVKASHLEQFEENINDEWIIGWNNKLNMSRMT